VRDRRKGPPPSRSTAARSPSGERVHRRRGRRQRHGAKPSRDVSGSCEMWDKQDGERASRDNGGRVAARALASAAPPLTCAGPVHRTWGRRPRRRRQALKRRWGKKKWELGFFPGAGRAYIPCDLDGVNLRRRSGDRRSATDGGYLGQKWPMRGVALGRFGGPAVDCRTTAQAGAWQAGCGMHSATGPNGWL
jgi:hypothetical protein